MLEKPMINRTFGKITKFAERPRQWIKIANKLGNNPVSKFLKDHGVKTEEFVDRYSSELTKDLGITNHEVSGLTFFLKIIEWITANY